MSDFSKVLNDKQLEATLYTEGPLLILAGAGSGKTRVLIHRIAYLIEEKRVAPWNICAITFTNKAAKEMRERVDKYVKGLGEQVWVATFHSTCVRILRRHIDRIGYNNSFTIYDTDDQKQVMKRILKEMDANVAKLKERTVLGYISDCKNKLISPAAAKEMAQSSEEMLFAKLYQAYQDALEKSNALDFDDLIAKTVELFEADEEVLHFYQERFRYIMVDEYQDTNYAQFRLIELLAGKYRNICVVGDDDQSIYGFRGADIENILGFEQVFPGTKVVKLERNYRSMGNILEVANHIIHNNTYRKDKSLWTDKDAGEKVVLNEYQSSRDEASGVVKEIRYLTREHGNFDDFAILYRNNSLSRSVEEQCVAQGIPYQLVGGVNFYQRKEIKDVLAYVKTIVNATDEVAFSRIINVPKRGIGATSVAKILDYASAHQLGILEACEMVQLSGKAKASLAEFTALMTDLRQRKEELTPKELIEEVLEKTGYRMYLLEEGEIEAASRNENIDELIAKARDFESEGISAFLEDVALIADIDRMDTEAKRITLMTIHAAKGLEFPNVYIIGMEEGIFPSSMSIGEQGGVEEERRLCYVGVTRAEKHLTLSYAKSRMVHGDFRYSTPSRFLEEIPSVYLKGTAIFMVGEVQSPMHGSGMEKNRKPDGESLGMSFGTAAGGAFRADTAYKSQDTYFKKMTSQPAKQPIFGLNYGKEFKVERSESLTYQVGDRVKHVKFGEGVVIAIEKGKKDFEVSVEYDKFGLKKMMAGFAKLEKM